MKTGTVEKQQEPVTILLIDDNEVDIEAVRRAFSKRGIGNPIIAASDGREGLRMLREGEVPNPYLILLDLHMPRMDGLSFLRELRDDSELRSSVVFVLTTSDEPQDLRKAYDSFVAGYVVKGSVGDDFLELIDMLEQYWVVVTLPVGDS